MQKAVSVIERAAAYLILTTGWTRRGWAFLAGLLSALALPPFYAFPVLFITFPVLVWLMDSVASEPGSGLFSKLRPAFSTGWWFGFGYFLASLWWIGNALLVDGDRFAWLLPLAVVVLPAILAIFWGFAAAIARTFWRDDWRKLLALSASFAFCEYLRGFLFTGFPWNLLGYIATPTPLAMQSASVVGVYGMGILTVFVAALPGLVTPGRGMRGIGRKFAILVAIAMVCGHLGYGYSRLSKADSKTVENVKIRLVQPSIPQGDKMNADMEADIFDTLLNLSAGNLGDGGDAISADDAAGQNDSENTPESNGENDQATGDQADGEQAASPALPPPLTDDIDLVIWPESALPFFLTERRDALAAIGELLPDSTKLITGAVRYETVPGKPEGYVYNSVYVIDSAGEIVDQSDKVHLVPFGEYLPFQETLEELGFEQITQMKGGFKAGNVIHTLDAGAAGVLLPLICYEIIFPGTPVYNGEQPAWILNLTNDAWYGNTPGPYQHHLQSVVRGVELGLPVVRVANSGISSVSDSYGRELVATSFNEVTAVDAKLPAARLQTLYAKYGNQPLLIVCLILVLICIPKGISTKTDR